MFKNVNFSRFSLLLSHQFGSVTIVSSPLEVIFLNFDVTGSFIAGVGIGAVLRADSITEKTVAFAIGGLGLSAVLGADVGAEEAVAITALLMGVKTGAGIN